MGVKATQPEGRTSENDLDDRNGKGAEGDERIEEKIQDVLVPWVLRSKPKPQSKSKPKTKSHPRSGSKPPSTSSPNQNGNGDDSGNTTSDPVDEEGGADQEKEEVEVDEREEKEEEEKVFNRYYHLFIEGELRDLVYKAGEEEGYRILPSSSPGSSPLSTATTSTKEIDQDQDQDDGEGGSGHGKWLRIRGEGWEADNWWVEAEVGVGDGQ
jgi:tRNA (uracil-5-)-methyltransferase TRM9